MSISLAMIVKDEASCLGHCLQSVRGLVDEIVLVDTGSVDATVELARREGARVFHFPWVDDFAAARNESLRHCTCDWVLILDADEAVDALDHSMIREACQSPSAQAYHLTLRNYHRSGSYYIRDAMAQRNTSSYTEGHDYPFHVDTVGLRLCRRTPDLAYVGKIHELLDPYFASRGIPVQDLTGAVIHHFGKLAEERERAKAKLYLDLAMKDLAADPANSQLHFNVVQQGLQAQDWSAVLASAEAYLKLRSVVPSIIRFGAGLALQKQDRHQDALRHFEKVLREQPGHVLALTYRGISLATLGRGQEAERSWRKAMQVSPAYALPYVSLVDLCFAKGRLEDARAVIRQGMAHSPADPLMLNARLLFDLRLNDMEQAMTDAREALERCPGEGGGLWHRLVALAEYRAGRLPEAIAILERGLSLFPEHAALQRMRADFGTELEAQAGL